MDNSVTKIAICSRKRGIQSIPDFHCGLSFPIDQMVPSHSSCRSCFNAAARYRSSEKKKEQVRLKEELDKKTIELQMEQIKIKEVEDELRNKYKEIEKQKIDYEKERIAIELQVKQIKIDAERFVLENNTADVEFLEGELEKVKIEKIKLEKLLEENFRTSKLTEKENKRIQDKVEQLEAQLINKTETIKALRK